MTTQQQLQHLYWRAGFGPRPQDVTAGLSPRKALRQLLHDSAKFEPLVGPGLSYADPQGAVMTDPASTKNNPVPTGMVTTPDQPSTEDLEQVRQALAEAQADVLASGTTDLKLRLDGANRAASRAVRDRLRAGWSA